MGYRYLLLSLLPVIGIIIYLNGQNYDPGLLNFQTDTLSTSSVTSYFPQKNDAYQRVGQIRQYTRENLYEYINGHAEYFLALGFEKLAVADYSSKSSEQNDSEFVVDIYDMGKSKNAFGILMDESGENATPVEVGFRGFLTQKTLNFIKGQYYIKISAFHDNAPLVKFAGGIEKKFGDLQNSLPQFQKFPRNGRIVNSIKFIKENYHGLSFVNNVYEQGYEINGERFSAFLIEGNNDEIKKLSKQYTEFFKEDGIEYHMIQYKQRNYYKVMDPFEGDWFLIPLNKELFGIYGSLSDKVLRKFIDDL
jgi:hypothetical protein